MNWATSEDPREMLRHAAGSLPRVVLCRVLADVAETALPYCGDETITAAVWAWDATRRWCRGEADLEEVKAAAGAAGAAWAAGAWAAEAGATAAEATAAEATAAGAAWAAWATAAGAYKRRLHSLAILVRLRLPYDPATTTYALWRDTPICPEMIRDQRLCEAAMVQWDADCEAGKVPVFNAR